MTENNTNVKPSITIEKMRREAKKQGLHLVTVKNKAMGTSGWMVVDENNIIQAGEKGMSLEELADYFAQ